MTRKTIFSLPLAVIFAAVASLAGASTASAALLTHESFDYSTGSIFHKTNAAAGWGGEWKAYGSPAPQVVAGSLSDPTGTLVTSGNMMAAPDTSVQTTWNGDVDGSVDNSVGLAFNKDGTDAGTNTVRWASLLIRQDSADATANFGVEMGNTYRYVNNLTFGVFGGQLAAGLKNADADSGITPVVGTTYFLALKFDWSGGAKPKLTLFVDPTPGSTTPADSTGYSGTANGNFGWGDTNTGTIDFTGGTSVRLVGQGYTIDELRFGDTYADVAPVPEPASAALLLAGLGGLLMLPRRRRRDESVM